MNPAIAHVLQFFSYEHLPADLIPTSKLFCELAQALVAEGRPQNQEVTVGLRKLLEAKDCFVRALRAK